jgi:RNase adaptor protein for sRNA GlmZ degradation
MFGLEILDVVIGLMFVYLLLALFATALNEYVAAVINLRGKELAKGLGKLLDDIDEKDALKKAFDGIGPNVNAATATLTERFYNHRLIRPLATRLGWVSDGVRPSANAATATLTERFYNHRLIRPLATRRGWAFDVFSKEPRLPSYIPARTFALALLDPQQA